MNAKQKSASGLIRLGVLLLILVVIGGAFAYDRFVMVPAGEATVKKVAELCLKTDATKEQVRAAAGTEPESTEEIGNYVVEHYSFGRILPNLPGYKISVLYLDGEVKESFTGEFTDEDRAAIGSEPVSPASEPDESGEAA